MKKITFDLFFGAPKCSKLVFVTVSFDYLYQRDIIITILNELNISIHNIQK